MKIHTLRALQDNFMFMLSGANQVAAIDPGEAAPVQAYLEANGLKLTHILCTHHHWDHINGVEELKDRWNAEVFCSLNDLGRIPMATRGLSDGEKVLICGETADILLVPGHTLGQLAYHFADCKAVFVGDTLFSCGCGRLFEGTAEQMWASLCRLRGLPRDTQVYFGHEYTLRNIEFVESHVDANPKQIDKVALGRYRAKCEHDLRSEIPTVPTTIETELKINPLFNAPDVETFANWRNLRNDWR